MDNSFDIPVLYKGEEINFKAELVIAGFTSRINVDVNGIIIFFEPDEERNYRALVDSSTPQKQIDIALLKAIADKIQSLIS
jgi:hypothetical protein